MSSLSGLQVEGKFAANFPGLYAKLKVALEDGEKA
jgi:hypothetical protein